MKEAAAFIGDLQEAQRPGILVGGGAYQSREAIMRFAEKNKIPVFRTWNAIDVATDDSEAYAGTVGTYGGPGRNFGIQNTDLLLILGCRISGRITGGQPKTFARVAKKYWVDLDAGLLGAHEVCCDKRVQGDCGDFIKACDMEDNDRSFDEWMAKCQQWRVLYDPVKVEHLKNWHHYGVMLRLSQKIPANAIVAYDTGGNSIMMGHCFRSKSGQRIFSSNGNTPMGFSMCGAIGAWFAQPDRPVVCIIGDGGMQLNIQELQTIKHYGANVKVFILNNKVLGNTLAYQRVNKKPEVGCTPATGYSSPDFVRVAMAYGLEAYRVDDWAQFDKAVDYALGAPHAVIVDIVDEDRCNYEPRISRWDTPIEDAYPHLPRDEFRAQMIIEPSEGWEGVN